MKIVPTFFLLIFMAGVSYAQDIPANIMSQSKFYIRNDSDSIGLIAEYFSNKTLSGIPLGTVIEPAVFHEWDKSPDITGMPEDNFSVRWTGVIRCDSTMDYVFDVAGDDGYRLWVDNEKIIDAWKDQAITETKQTILLQKGKEYPVKLEYYEAGGAAVIYFAYYAASHKKFEFIPEVSWANTERYKKANSALDSTSTGENRVVFMGNSITEGWGGMCPDFFSKNSYINRGISGQTTPQMLVRFRSDVIKLKPAVVIILAGTNDIAGNTGPSTLEMILDNIISMAELAKANHIKVVLCSVLPTIDYPWNIGLEPAEKIATLNNMIKNYADKNGILYVDYYTHMVDEQKGLIKEYTFDGVHPNEAGYKIMEPLAQEAIKKVLNMK